MKKGEIMAPIVIEYFCTINLRKHKKVPIMVDARDSTDITWIPTF